MRSDPTAEPRFDAELLKILVCPKCKGPLTLSATMHTLDCGACRLRYLIHGGIPILLPDEAEAF